MNYLKRFSISYAITIITYFLLLIIMTFFSYINTIKGSSLTILKLIISIFSIFIGSFIFGKKARKKGWLEGIKFGIILIIFIILINFIFYKTFAIKQLIYYLIILMSSILGSMFGLLRKKTVD